MSEMTKSEPAFVAVVEESSGSLQTISSENLQADIAYVALTPPSDDERRAMNDQSFLETIRRFYNTLNEGGISLDQFLKALDAGYGLFRDLGNYVAVTRNSIQTACENIKPIVASEELTRLQYENRILRENINVLVARLQNIEAQPPAEYIESPQEKSEHIHSVYKWGFYGMFLVCLSLLSSFYGKSFISFFKSSSLPSSGASYRLEPSPIDNVSPIEVSLVPSHNPYACGNITLSDTTLNESGQLRKRQVSELTPSKHGCISYNDAKKKVHFLPVFSCNGKEGNTAVVKISHALNACSSLSILSRHLENKRGILNGPLRHHRRTFTQVELTLEDRVWQKKCPNGVNPRGSFETDC